MDFKYGTIIKNSKIPSYLSWFISIRAITIWPFIIFKDDPDVETVNHERIHIMQQRELFIVLFYILYFSFWILNKIKGQTNFDAYYNIPFEKEAYENHNNIYYILNRKKFSWINYL